jgi:hypothetical protein
MLIMDAFLQELHRKKNILYSAFLAVHAIYTPNKRLPAKWGLAAQCTYMFIILIS